MMRAPVLVGPTASGKSAFAPALAAATNGEIVSADSGAVYREMDVGTAKPPPSMRAQLPHHLVDIRAPNDTFNAGVFRRLAIDAMTDIRARNKTPLLVGGAMMYLHVLARGLRDAPEVTAAVRDAVRAAMRKRGAAKMHEQLAKIDPHAARNIRATDSQRIARALEIAAASRRPSPSFANARATEDNPRLAFIILLPADRARLRAEIDLRLQKMWADGLVAETAAAIEKYNLSAESPPLRMAGYRQAAAFLRGECSESEMRERAYYATCRLAKRQMTWLRGWQNPAAVIDPFAADAETKIIAAAKTAISRRNAA